MTPSDLIYDHVFKLLMKDGLTQKEAGDYAARAVHFYKHGVTHKDAIKKVLAECKATIKTRKKKCLKPA